MAHNCSSIADELDRLLVDREIFEWGTQRPGVNNPRWSAWLALNRRITDAQRRLRDCINTPHGPFTPVPVHLSVRGLTCFDQEDGPGFWPFDTEDDEPYVLVFTLNIPIIEAALAPPRLSVNLPRPRVVKIGPWESVDDNSQMHPAPPNTIWDAASGLITRPTEVILIASLVENDSSSPEAVRKLVEDLMFAELILHATSALTPDGRINRVEFVRRLVDGMSGNVAFATTPIGSGGVLDPDDQIGPAMELQLTTRNLESAFSGRTVAISLTFRGEGADYRVTFQLRRF